MPEPGHEGLSVAASQFRTTHWSAVVRAGNSDSIEAASALNELCQVYWYPLYAFARRQGNSAAEAEDLTQGFFARLIERGYVARADQEKGRFRTFLLTLFRRHIANEWNREHMQKRGGLQPKLSLDAAWAESRYGAEPAQGNGPDVLFNRQWARILLDQVMNRLENDYRISGRESLFERLEACVAQDETALRYSEIAEELGLTEPAVKMAMQRMRARYRAILREEIAKTVVSPDEIDAEIKELFAAFKS
jgi:RNA polymerase sigma factor (sigma-70 family)